MTETIVHSIGELFTIMRKRRKMSQVKLAELAGCSRNYVGQIEHDKARPTVDMLISLADAMGYQLKVELRKRDGEA